MEGGGKTRADSSLESLLLLLRGKGGPDTRLHTGPSWKEGSGAGGPCRRLGNSLPQASGERKGGWGGGGLKAQETPREAPSFAGCPSGTERSSGTPGGWLEGRGRHRPRHLPKRTRPPPNPPGGALAGSAEHSPPRRTRGRPRRRVRPARREQPGQDRDPRPPAGGREGGRGQGRGLCPSLEELRAAGREAGRGSSSSGGPRRDAPHRTGSSAARQKLLAGPPATLYPSAAMKLERPPSADPPLEFTVATEKEFEEILAMSKGIYGGLDYLPSRYHAWIREPNRTVVLAKKNGSVIGLQSVFIIDAGETALVEGLRVAPWERGKGVAGVLQRFCSEMVKEKHPSVKVSRLTRDDKLGPRDFQKYRVIAKQGILLVRFSAPELLSRLDATVLALAEGGFCPEPSELLLDSEVPEVVLQESFRNEVLPNQTIIQDWQPFKAMESNLGLLRQKELCWVVDQKAQPTVATLSTRPFAIPLGEDWCYLNVDVFGHDLGHIKSQLIHQLRLQAPRFRAKVMCQLFLDPALWLEMATFCQSALGLELAKDYTEQYLLESDI